MSLTWGSFWSFVTEATPAAPPCYQTLDVEAQYKDFHLFMYLLVYFEEVGNDGRATGGWWLQVQGMDMGMSAGQEEPHNPHLNSYKHLVWKNPLNPTVSLTLSSLPPKEVQQVPRHHLYMSFEYLQGW